MPTRRRPVINLTQTTDSSQEVTPAAATPAAIPAAATPAAEPLSTSTTPAPESFRRPLKWTKEAEQVLFTTLAQCVKDGKRTDSGTYPIYPNIFNILTFKRHEIGGLEGLYCCTTALSWL